MSSTKLVSTNNKKSSKIEVKLAKPRKKRLTKKEKEEIALKRINQMNVWNYPYKNWRDKFTNNNVNFIDIKRGSTWGKVLDPLMEDKRMRQMEDFLSFVVKESRKQNIDLFPYPDLIFNAFNLTPYKKVKVVIIGQDPYFNSNMINNSKVPEAMGLSFSVPVGIKIPSSLRNVYKNLMKYNQLNVSPKHGNLSFWAHQGVLMINSELTVQEKIAHSHKGRWTWFTKKVIKHLNKHFENLVFIMWGKPAMELCWPLVNDKKHKCIVTSHPSGLSCNRGFSFFPAFMKYDTFGETNKYLKEHGKEEIVWQI